MSKKKVIMPERQRKTPAGFGWVDHRLVRDSHVRGCTTDALALYLILITVADRRGLSYYSDALLCTILGWSRERLETARGNLEDADLIIFSEPLYQVLSLPVKEDTNHD